MKRKDIKIWSNVVYLLKLAYKINKNVFFTRIPQIILNAASPFIPIIFLRLILNEITVGKDTYKTFLYVFLLALTTFIFNILGSMLNARVQHQMEITVRKMKSHLSNVVMNMLYQDAEQPKIRDFISLAEDSTNLTHILDNISAVLTSSLTILGLTGVIITVQPIILFFILLVVILRLIADKKSRALWEKWRPQYAPIMRKSNYFTRIMKSIEFGKEIRINNIQEWLLGKNSSSADTYLDASKQHNVEIQKNNISVSVASILQESIVYLVLAYKVVFQGMAIGDFSMYMTSVTSFADGTIALMGALSAIMETGVFISDFRYCVEIANQEDPHDTRKTLNKPAAVCLEFRNVSFRYPNTERMILHNVSLKLHTGLSYAIVGMNGSGKTTLVKLICRLYEPTEGEILLNGVNVQEYAFDEYISLISAVFQDYKLLAFSIEENIAFHELSDKQSILDCLGKSGLDQKVSTLTKGIKTSISKEFDVHGIELSGGEGQKLAMSRAIYKGASILIMDEPTSALDPLAEAEMYEKLNEIATDKLAIYISHRLSSCLFCNKIIVLEDGKITQCGNHKELINSDGLYSHMWNIQSDYYTEKTL